MTTKGGRYADGPTAYAEIIIDAPPGRVWPLISDPLLMPELSTEVALVEWLDGATRAALGARFRGHNQHPAIGEWTTTNTIVRCDVDREFSWVVENIDDPTATWTFTLAPSGEATVLSQHARMGPGRSGLTIAIERWPDKEERIVERRLSEWEAAIVADLAEIKARAESGG